MKEESTSPAGLVMRIVYSDQDLVEVETVIAASGWRAWSHAYTTNADIIDAADALRR